MDKLLILLGLGILLYLGIYVNYYLSDLSIPLFVNWMFIIGIVLLIVLELILCYLKYGNYLYEFREHNLVIIDNQTREISYSNIRGVHYYTNFLDTWFKTGSIVLNMKDGKNIKLKYLDNPNQAYFLVQKSIKS